MIRFSLFPPFKSCIHHWEEHFCKATWGQGSLWRYKPSYCEPTMNWSWNNKLNYELDAKTASKWHFQRLVCSTDSPKRTKKIIVSFEKREQQMFVIFVWLPYYSFFFSLILFRSIILLNHLFNTSEREMRIHNDVDKCCLLHVILIFFILWTFTELLLDCRSNKTKHSSVNTLPSPSLSYLRFASLLLYFNCDAPQHQGKWLVCENLLGNKPVSDSDDSQK